MVVGCDAVQSAFASNLTISSFFGVILLLGNYEIMNLMVGRTAWTGDKPVARPLATEDNTNTGRKSDMHASSEIRTQDPSV
jgi:hypothetical protein